MGGASHTVDIENFTAAPINSTVRIAPDPNSCMDGCQTYGSGGGSLVCCKSNESRRQPFNTILIDIADPNSETCDPTGQTACDGRAFKMAASFVPALRANPGIQVISCPESGWKKDDSVRPPAYSCEFKQK